MLVFRRRLPGVVTQVVRQGKIVFEDFDGYNSKDKIFRLFSQTKPITAVAFMTLVSSSERDSTFSTTSSGGSSSSKITSTILIVVAVIVKVG